MPRRHYADFDAFAIAAIFAIATPLILLIRLHSPIIHFQIDTRHAISCRMLHYFAIT